MDKAVGKVVGWVVKKGRALWDKVKGVAGKVFDKVKGLFGIKKKFTAVDGNEHELYYSGKGNSAKLMVASFDPSEVSKKINIQEKKIAKTEVDPRKKASIKISIKLARTHLQKVVEKQRIWTNEKKSHKKKKCKEELIEAINILAKPMKYVMMDLDMDKTYPMVRFPSFKDNVIAQNSLKVDYLNKSVGYKQGTASNRHKGKLHGWDLVEEFKLVHKGGGPYVKMHILSEALGGQAVDSNLTPAPTQTNTDFNKKVESKAEKVINEGGMIWYDVFLNYGHKIPYRPANGSGERIVKFVDNVKAYYGFYDYDAGKKEWKRKTEPVVSWDSGSIAPPKTEVEPVNVNTENDDKKISETLKISKSKVRIIIANRPYSPAFNLFIRNLEAQKSFSKNEIANIRRQQEFINF